MIELMLLYLLTGFVLQWFGIRHALKQVERGEKKMGPVNPFWTGLGMILTWPYSIAYGLAKGAWEAHQDAKR